LASRNFKLSSPRASFKIYSINSGSGKSDDIRITSFRSVSSRDTVRFNENRRLPYSRRVTKEVLARGSRFLDSGGARLSRYRVAIMSHSWPPARTQTPRS